MSLRYALLALLTARPLTGYELAKQFSTSVGYVWHAPDSQIYPELRRMESAGLVRACELTSATRRVKREYSITDDGVRQFAAWMNSTTDYQPERDVHHLKAAYFEWSAADVARAQMREHIAFHTARLEQWLELRRALVARTNPTLSARLAGRPAEQHERIVAFKVFAYDGLIARARTEISWARRGLDLIDELTTEPEEPLGRDRGRRRADSEPVGRPPDS